TKTEKGLTVTSQLDEQIYKKGIQITEEQMNGLNLKKNQLHGEWNYSIKKQKRIT
ncbi:MAG: ISAzo13 family transposase, partial [Prevotellaceae bacterium]|nr:ISAzo13 family transposase [Prevotellaceae bacterium]